MILAYFIIGYIWSCVAIEQQKARHPDTSLPIYIASRVLNTLLWPVAIIFAAILYIKETSSNE